MVDPPEKSGSLSERALGKRAEEFSDATTGAGEQLGEAARILSDQAVVVARAVRAALLPLRLLVYGYQELERRFFPLLEERIEQIPPDRRVPPPLLIAGPTVEAAKFAVEEPELCKLFANLLATSMDRATAELAHPSFVDIVKQLTPDEARILKQIAKVQRSKTRPEPQPVVDVCSVPPGQSGYQTKFIKFSHLGLQAGVTRNDLTPASLDNLCRLGLCEMPLDRFINRDEPYLPLEMDTALSAIRSEIKAEGGRLEFHRRMIYPTNLGLNFLEACVIDRTGE